MTKTSPRRLIRPVATFALALSLGLSAVSPAAAGPAAGAVLPTQQIVSPASTIAAEVTKPKITIQPENATAIAGQMVKIPIKATGTDLKYRWYIVRPGTSKWVATNKTSATFSTRAQTKQNASLLKVVVSNSAGKVTSKIVRLKVLSTLTHPVAKLTPVWLTKWRVSTVATSTHAWSRIKAENRYNDPAPAGYEYILTRFQVQHRATVKTDPAYGLDFKFVSNGGKAYKSAVVVTPDDLFDVGKIAPGEVVTFMVAVAVPKSIEGKGVWLVTDFVDYKNTQLAYFRF